MTNPKTVLGIALVAMVIAIGGYLFPGVQTKVVEKVTESLGAQSQQVAEGDCTTINGLNHCFVKQTFRTSTSTVCSVPLPRAASSTVIYTAMSVRLASTTGVTYAEIGVGSGNNATTTATVKSPIPATQGGFFVGSTTPFVNNTSGVLPAINFNIAGGIIGEATGFVPQGYCLAEYIY